MYIRKLKMQTSSQLRKEFLKKWIKGLQICCSTKKEMSLMERKKKIKLSADVALASAKCATTSWSNAIISEAKREEENTILINNLLGSYSLLNLRKGSHQMVTCQKRVRSKKILKKSVSVSKRTKKLGPHRSNSAIGIAKRLVKKRTQVLKRLLPGGESMDEFSLIKEALDYILSLRVQVDVMRSIANATDFLNQNTSTNVD